MEATLAAILSKWTKQLFFVIFFFIGSELNNLFLDTFLYEARITKSSGYFIKSKWTIKHFCDTFLHGARITKSSEIIFCKKVISEYNRSYENEWDTFIELRLYIYVYKWKIIIKKGYFIHTGIILCLTRHEKTQKGWAIKFYSSLWWRPVSFSCPAIKINPFAVCCKQNKLR